MTTLQTDWTEQELLQTHPVEVPLVAGGVVCHGGFDADGGYVSPRTLNRLPAIEAWQQQRAEQFGTPLIDIELSAWPGNYPNVAQAKYLLAEGVREPLISTLTRIGTVEGFGALIRHSPIPDLQVCFDEPITGTAMAHLNKGLYEAHARDEAGYGDEGGHQQMWFAAHDIAFDHPVTADQTQVMLDRMGLSGRVPTKKDDEPAADLGSIRKQMLGIRDFDDIDFDLEMLIARMSSLLLIEISAFHTFAWAEEVLGDTSLVAGDGEAARLVSYIRTDETPHVEYLKTTLSEIRDRTFIGESGRKHAGAEIVGSLWEKARQESLLGRRVQVMNLTLSEVTHALEGNGRKDEILEQFHALGTMRPNGDGTWEQVA